MAGQITRWLAIALLALAPGQAVPDFTGSWTLASPDESARGGRGPIGEGPTTVSCAEACSIRQDKSALIVERQFRDSKFTMTVYLDGRESVSSNVMGTNPVEMTARASWVGRQLVIKTRSSMNPNEVTVTVELDGKEMVVTTSRPNPRGAGDAMVTTRRYVRR